MLRVPAGVRAEGIRVSYKQIGIGVVAAVALVLVLFALFGEKRLDTEDAASKIAAELGGGATVECPDDVTVEDGATFECTADIEGESIPVQVELIGEDGDFRFTLAPAS